MRILNCKAWTLALLLGCSTLALGACSKKVMKAPECKGDTDCNNGTLCEAKMCIPDEIAELARSARAAQKKEKAQGEPAAAGDGKEVAAAKDAAAAKDINEEPVDDGPIPIIPKEKSDPPQGGEWDKGILVNTQNIHGIAPNCTMKVLREWLRVFCRGKVLGFEQMQEFGSKKVDYFESIREGVSASFVLRIKQGARQTVRICREDNRASLVVYWPKNKERPEHIALGTGPRCEGEEWGAPSLTPKGVEYGH